MALTADIGSVLSSVSAIACSDCGEPSEPVKVVCRACGVCEGSWALVLVCVCGKQESAAMVRAIFVWGVVSLCVCVCVCLCVFACAREREVLRHEVCPCVSVCVSLCVCLLSRGRIAAMPRSSRDRRVALYKRPSRRFVHGQGRLTIFPGCVTMWMWPSAISMCGSACARTLLAHRAAAQSAKSGRGRRGMAACLEGEREKEEEGRKER